MYLTPERFKTMGTGVEIPEDLAALRSAINRASSRIDTACAVPRLPQRFDFRGGLMVDEEHVWVIDPYERPHPFQFWPYAGPVIEVVSFAIWSTNHINVPIDPDNIFINNSAGYVELSSIQLTQFGVFGAGLVPLLGLYNPVAKMTYRYGHRFEVVDEEAEPVDARTYQTQNQFWTVDDVVVKVDDTIVTSGFAINRTEGWIKFDDNQAPNTVVTVSYTYSLDSDIAQACALLVAEELGESDLRAKEMTGVESIKVTQGGGASVELRRPPVRRAVEASAFESLPAAVQTLLSGHIFVTVR